MDGITPVMKLGLSIQNTNNQPFTLNSLAGEVYSNNYLIGRLGTFQSQTINGNSETVIYVDCRLSLLGIVNDMLDAIRNKTFSQAIELEMVANIDNVQFVIPDIKFKFGKAA